MGMLSAIGLPSELPIFGKSKSIDDIARAMAADNVLSAPTAFSIQETTGRRRLVRLTARCLPFRPVDLTARQRMKIEYYPGSTEAVAQVFGPHHTDLTVKGILLARYMNPDGPSGGGGFDYEEPGSKTQHILTPEHGRKILLDMCRSGQEVVVKWGRENFETVQRGLIEAVRFPEHRPQRIEWEIHFEWIADSELKPQEKFPAPKPKAKSLLDSLQDMLDAAKEVLDETKGAYKDYITQPVAKLAAMVQQVDDLLDEVAIIAALPAQTAKSILLTAQQVKQDVWDIQASALALRAQYAAVADEWAATGDSIDFLPWTSTQGKPAGEQSSAATQAKLAVQQKSLTQGQHKLLATAQQVSDAAAQYIVSDYLDVYMVKDGDTLRKVSILYYGTQDHWQDVAECNDLAGDDLSVGMFLVIPAVA
jgi:LysM repeat protein